MDMLLAILNFVNAFQLETNTLPTSAEISARFPERRYIAEWLARLVTSGELMCHMGAYAITSAGLDAIRPQLVLDPAKVLTAQESNEHAQRRMFENRPSPKEIRRAIWGNLMD